MLLLVCVPSVVCVFVCACIALWTRLDSGCRFVVLHRRARSRVEGFADSVSQLHIAVSMTTVVFLAPPAWYWASLQRSDSLGDGVVVATAVWAGLGFALHLPCLLALSEASGPTVHRPGTSIAVIYLLVYISLFFLSKSPLLSRLDLSFLPFPVRPTPQFLRTAPSTRKGSGSVQRNKFSSTWADLSSAPGFDCIHTFKVQVCMAHRDDGPRRDTGMHNCGWNARKFCARAYMYIEL